jgi:hypothetical protein
MELFLLPRVLLICSPPVSLKNTAGSTLKAAVDETVYD